MEGWLWDRSPDLTFTSGSNNSASFTVSAPIGNLERALNGLTYTPSFGYTGGGPYPGGVCNDPADGLSAPLGVELTINPITAPAITAPATATLSENGSLVLNTANNNAVSVADNEARGSMPTPRPSRSRAAPSRCQPRRA